MLMKVLPLLLGVAAGMAIIVILIRRSENMTVLILEAQDAQMEMLNYRIDRLTSEIDELRDRIKKLEEDNHAEQ